MREIRSCPTVWATVTVGSYGRVEKRYLGRVHTPKIASSSLASATTGGSQALYVCGLHARYSRDRYGGLYARVVELADTAVSKTVILWVQIPPFAPSNVSLLVSYKKAFKGHCRAF